MFIDELIMYQEEIDPTVENMLEKTMISLITHSRWEIQAHALYRFVELISQKSFINPTFIKKLSLEEKLTPLLTHAQWKVQQQTLHLLGNLVQNEFIDSTFIKKLELEEKIKTLLTSHQEKIQKAA